MESFKKVISLNQAAQLSGYTQDYLGFLVRNGEIKGMKKGRTWFTTEDEVRNYVFKKKVRNEEFAIKEFFSTSRTKKIIIIATILFIGSFLLFSDFNKHKTDSVKEIQSAVASDGEGIKIIKN